MAELTMQNLGGATQVAPAVVESVWGRVGMFIHSSATHTVHLRWREMDGSLAAWEDLQSPIAGAPVAARAYDGRTGVYFRNPDGRLVCQRQNNDGSAWITDITDAKLRGNPVVGCNANRRMEVFVEGDDGALWHLWATGDGPELGASGRFGGSNVRAIAWALTTGGRQAFFHTNTANELWLIQQTAPNGGWSAFSGPAKDIPADLSAVGFAGDRLAVVFTDANGAVQLRAEPPGGGTLGGSLALSASGTKARGRPTGFRLQDERLLAVWWQQTPQNQLVSANQSTVEDAPWIVRNLGCPQLAEAPVTAQSAMGELHLGLRLADGTVSYSLLPAPA